VAHSNILQAGHRKMLNSTWVRAGTNMVPFHLSLVNRLDTPLMQGQYFKVINSTRTYSKAILFIYYLMLLHVLNDLWRMECKNLWKPIKIWIPKTFFISQHF